MTRRHRYDQHFLKNPRVVAELVGHTNIRKNDFVYDFGAGSGVTTSVLATRCRQVVALEIEPTALEKLRFNTGHLANIIIKKQDILKFRPPSETYKIFGNIPFSLSADIVRLVTNLDQPPKAAYFIVQKQFAKKLVPCNDHFTNVLCAQVSPFFVCKIRKPLRRNDFTPPPGVDTVLLEIKPRETIMIEKEIADDYKRFIDRCFSNQKFYRALKSQGANIPGQKNPSQLTTEEWVTLFNSAVER